MRNTAKLDDVTWVMLFDAGINVDNAHRFPGLHSILVYSEDGRFKATFGPTVDYVGLDSETEVDLGWTAEVVERRGDTWEDPEYAEFATAAEVVKHVAKSLGYAT